eukprot:6197951-Pleurochrysis_carterae.AAC.2
MLPRGVGADEADSPIGFNASKPPFQRALACFATTHEYANDLALWHVETRLNFRVSAELTTQPERTPLKGKRGVYASAREHASLILRLKRPAVKRREDRRWPCRGQARRGRGRQKRVSCKPAPKGRDLEVHRRRLQRPHVVHVEHRAHLRARAPQLARARAPPPSQKSACACTCPICLRRRTQSAPEPARACARQCKRAVRAWACRAAASARNCASSPRRARHRARLCARCSARERAKARPSVQLPQCLSVLSLAPVTSTTHSKAEAEDTLVTGCGRMDEHAVEP